MSHFCVLVVGPNHEEQLAPFQENNMGDCPKHLLSFHEDKDCEKDEETGKNGYWENPNAKWDWYCVGGRWTGFFKVKQGVYGQLGSPGLMTSPARFGHADILTKGDIDLPAMRDEAEKEAAEKYDRAMLFLGHLPANESWEVVRGSTEDLEAARTAFWAQPRCVAWRDEEKRVGYKNWQFGYSESPDSFLISRAQYIQNARDGAGVTFAVIKDGQWTERGSMGWFGCVSDEKDQQTWQSMFAKMLDSLPDDTQLTVVDCHI